jgi:molybdopterin synthase sulfur carrier subunit
MKVQLKLFAIARQLVGNDVIDLELQANATVATLRMELITQIPELKPMAGQLRFAVNADYAADSTLVSEKDELACIPPVSGG